MRVERLRLACCCRWIPRISYLNYAYVAVLKNELYGLELRDPDGALVMGQSLFPTAIDNGWVLCSLLVQWTALGPGP